MVFFFQVCVYFVEFGQLQLVGLCGVVVRYVVVFICVFYGVFYSLERELEVSGLGIMCVGSWFGVGGCEVFSQFIRLVCLVFCFFNLLNELKSCLCLGLVVNGVNCLILGVVGFILRLVLLLCRFMVVWVFCFVFRVFMNCLDIVFLKFMLLLQFFYSQFWFFGKVQGEEGY